MEWVYQSRPALMVHPKVEYTPEQLDLLAMLFTVIKVAFVGGALGLAARLTALVDTARLASAIELHTTSIRNEAAYFGCVSRVCVLCHVGLGGLEPLHSADSLFLIPPCSWLSICLFVARMPAFPAHSIFVETRTACQVGLPISQCYLLCFLSFLTLSPPLLPLSSRMARGSAAR